METLIDKLGYWLDIDLHLTSKQILSWFVYDSENPLLFNSGLFLGLFLVFYLIYIATKKFVYFRIGYVLLFSLFFYYKAGGMFFVLLIASCLVNYGITKAMSITNRKGERKSYLVFLIILNLFILGYYKYTYFILENVNLLLSQKISFQSIILPIGISFYTFQAISYAVDLYKKDIEPAKSIFDFSFYLCFFPQLVAGPIVRAKEFIPQIRKKVTLSQEEASAALFLIMMGLLKKAVISDYISLNFVDRIFDNPLNYTSFENLLAVYGYALQIYCDFSGYSDMAIGIALLMGFTLPINFNSPYKSQSTAEFWRRWHISLSTWLRDYLYIPMGGNRKGKFRTYLNLWLTMLIGGLWHGAAWKFIIWGGLHGSALALERGLKQYIKVPQNFATTIICTFLTFHFVAFCWIFFRASSFENAFEVISQVSSISFEMNDWLTIIEAYKNVFILIAIGFILHFLPEKLADIIKLGFQKTPLIGKSIILGFVFWLVFSTASSGPQPFIYFQF